MKKFVRRAWLAAALFAGLGASAAPPAPAHVAEGVVKKIDAAKGTVTIAHGPVASLKWPAMTMPFKADASLLGSIAPGQTVRFEFVSSGTDSTITKIGAAR